MSKVSSAPVLKPAMGTTGYTPAEAAQVLTGQSFAFTAKQVRRALRKGNLTGNQVSGRWYINRRSLTAFAKAQGKGAKVKATGSKVKTTKTKARKAKAIKVVTPNGEPLAAPLEHAPSVNHDPAQGVSMV